MKRIPDHPLMGTKHKTENPELPFEYKWDTISEIVK